MSSHSGAGERRYDRKGKFPWFWSICALIAGLLVSAALFWYLTEPQPPFTAEDTSLEGPGDAARGRLVFAAGDCSSCHATPGQPDRLQLGGGMALESPFGTFRPPNISQHPTDGIGAWRTRDLANALIGGVSPDGRHYYPAFPYTSYTGMRTEDVKNLMAYLRTLPPVARRAPPHRPTILFSVRRTLGIWKLMFFHERKSDAKQTADEISDRGAYLVETVAHCAECHGARNVFGAIQAKDRFAGGKDPSGTGFIPNITPARIGHWSEAEIAEVLKSGRTPEHGRVGSSMADVVTNTASLPQSDRDAIARYIKSLPPRETPRP